MEVETFECQETITEPLECSEEAIKIIEDLGLQGQQDLIAKHQNNDVEQKERCPYRHIRKDEQFVYGQLCPSRTELNNFSECPIPLRVLQVLSHAKGLGLFKRFVVWSAEGVVKDPVLVAYDQESTWNANVYILARWGEELDEWPTLVKKAVSAWKQKAIAELHSIKNKVESDLKTIAEEAIGLETAMKRDQPSYYGWS